MENVWEKKKKTHFLSRTFAFFAWPRATQSLCVFWSSLNRRSIRPNIDDDADAEWLFFSLARLLIVVVFDWASPIHSSHGKKKKLIIEKQHSAESNEKHNSRVNELDAGKKLDSLGDTRPGQSAILCIWFYFSYIILFTLCAHTICSFLFFVICYQNGRETTCCLSSSCLARLSVCLYTHVSHLMGYCCSSSMLWLTNLQDISPSSIPIEYRLHIEQARRAIFYFLLFFCSFAELSRVVEWVQGMRYCGPRIFSFFLPEKRRELEIIWGVKS